MTAMRPFFTDNFGNPSASCSVGQGAKEAVNKAREAVARFIGAEETEIIFTSGGTESDNYALVGVAHANQAKGNHIITSPIEHHAILETCHFLENFGFRITLLPVDKHGMVDPDSVKKAITPETIIISIMHANNEIGTIQPITEIGRIAREAGVYFHTDAVQTLGHIPLNVNEMNIDLLSASAHKLYGPKGVGMIYIRNGTKIQSFMHGGAQEENRRAGTLNVPGIVGFGAAIELAMKEMNEEAERVKKLRDKLIESIMKQIPDAWLNGHPHMRLPNNANISFSYVEGEAAQMKLDLEGICVSTGSACSSVSQEPSHVLLSLCFADGMQPMRAHEHARSSLRFTLGKWTTENDIKRVLELLPRIIADLRAISPLTKKP